jgi:hypothetical protein
MSGQSHSFSLEFLQMDRTKYRNAYITTNLSIEEFDKQNGLSWIEVEDDFVYYHFKIIDKQLWFLAKIKYGF